MREGWTVAALADVAEVIMGRQLSPSKRLGVRPRKYLRAANVGNWGIDLSDLLEMDFTLEEESKFRVQSGDILLVEGGNEKSVGCPALVTEGASGLCIQNTLIRCRVKNENLVSPEFLFHLLRHEFWRGRFGELCAGTTIMHLGQKRASAFEVALPPIKVQRRIVDFVASVDAYIGGLEKQAEAARTARNAILHDILSNGGENWEKLPLGDVAEVLDRMRKPISGAEREKRPGSVPYYGATGRTGWIDKPLFNEELVLLGEDAIDFLNPDVHKAYLIDGPSWVNNHAHVLRARKNIVLSYFLMEVLNAVDYSQFVAFGTRSKLTQGSMMGITVSVPPISEQRRIVDLVMSFDTLLAKTDAALSFSKGLRAGLLSDLLSGSHEIPQSYDRFLGAA